MTVRGQWSLVERKKKALSNNFDVQRRTKGDFVLKSLSFPKSLGNSSPGLKDSGEERRTVMENWKGGERCPFQRERVSAVNSSRTSTDVENEGCERQKGPDLVFRGALLHD